MKEIQIKSGLVAKIEGIYDNFDASKTSADVNFILDSESGEQVQTIKFVVSDEFIADTFGHTGKITDELRENVLDLLVRRVVDEKGGVPRKIEAILALKVYMPLIYRAEIDMKNPS